MIPVRDDEGAHVGERPQRFDRFLSERVSCLSRRPRRRRRARGTQRGEKSRRLICLSRENDVINLERAKPCRTVRILAAVMNPVGRVRLCDKGFDACDFDPEVDLRGRDGSDQAADNAAHADGRVGDVVRVSKRVDDVVCAYNRKVQQEDQVKVSGEVSTVERFS